MKKSIFLTLSLGLLVIGCGTSRYGFRPTAITPSSEAGFPASHYIVPPDAPAGEAFVTSFGTREIAAQGDSSGQLVHVRLAIANQSSDAPWSIDPAQLMLTPPGGPAQRPDFMEVDGRQNGSTEIARGERRVLDVYYKMPAGAPDARALPAFDFSWQVNLGTKAFAEHTPFVREPYEEYERTNRQYVAVGVAAPWYWGFYGSPWWGPYGWPYYGYGPRIGFGFGVGVGGYYGPRYHGGGRIGGGGSYGGGRFGGGGRVAPTGRGRAR